MYSCSRHEHRLNDQNPRSEKSEKDSCLNQFIHTSDFLDNLWTSTPSCKHLVNLVNWNALHCPALCFWSVSYFTVPIHFDLEQIVGRSKNLEPGLIAIHLWYISPRNNSIGFNSNILEQDIHVYILNRSRWFNMPGYSSRNLQAFNLSTSKRSDIVGISTTLPLSFSRMRNILFPITS